MEIIVLKTTTYKEKDAILEGLSKDGIHSYLVKGLQSPKSSNIVLSNALVLADIEIQEGKYKYPIIKKTQIITSPYHLDDDINHLSAINLLDELTLNLLQEDERQSMYGFLKSAIIALSNRSVNLQSILLIYFMKAIKEAGFTFEVNACTRCGGKKGIAAFSFDEGGFICKNCLTPEDELSLSVKAMMALRNAVLLDSYQDITELNEDVFKEIAIKLKAFIYDYLGVKLISIDLLF